MTRLLCLSALALGLFVAATPQSPAHAQTLSIGRGGVQYNGYGRGYYGGYGQGYRGHRYGHDGHGHGHVHGGWHSPRTQTYSAYGNGPYGYGSGRSYQYPSNGGYSYGDGNYHNGYGYSGYYAQPYAPVYRPYGFGVYIQ